VPDTVYAQVRAQFSEEELANLTLAIIAINGANRLNIAFRTVPGSYRVRPREAAEKCSFRSAPLPPLPPRDAAIVRSDGDARTSGRSRQPSPVAGYSTSSLTNRRSIQIAPAVAATTCRCWTSTSTSMTWMSGAAI
jgi:hypothetical protein